MNKWNFSECLLSVAFLNFPKLILHLSFPKKKILTSWDRLSRVLTTKKSLQKLHSLKKKLAYHGNKSLSNLKQKQKKNNKNSYRTRIYKFFMYFLFSLLNTIQLRPLITLEWWQVMKMKIYKTKKKEKWNKTHRSIKIRPPNWCYQLRVLFVYSWENLKISWTCVSILLERSFQCTFLNYFPYLVLSKIRLLISKFIFTIICNH